MAELRAEGIATQHGTTVYSMQGVVQHHGDALAAGKQEIVVIGDRAICSVTETWESAQATSQQASNTHSGGHAMTPWSLQPLLRPQRPPLSESKLDPNSPTLISPSSCCSRSYLLVYQRQDV